MEHLQILLFFVGLFILIKGADFLIDGASGLAQKLGLPAVLIGLTVVAFGTSLPELFVSIFAISENSGDIVLGNIVGSNISNILLVLGVTAIFAPIVMHNSVVKREIPLSLLATLVVLFLANLSFITGAPRDTNELGFVQGIILLVLFAISMAIIFSKNNVKQHIPKKTDAYSLIMGSITIGVFGLYLGGKWTVEGAIYSAQLLGFSEYFIAATVIAVGTSLPELVTSVRAVFSKKADLAVGNIIGSNIFNLLLVLGATALFLPMPVAVGISYDLIILILATLAMIILAKDGKIGQKEGIFLVIGYVIYLVLLSIRG